MGSVIVARHARYCLLIELVSQVFSWLMYLTLVTFCLFSFPPHHSNQLHKQKLPGVYVMPSAKSPLVWNGVIFVRQGLYEGCALRFTLTIPDNYPDGDCPVSHLTLPSTTQCGTVWDDDSVDS